LYSAGLWLAVTMIPAVEAEVEGGEVHHLRAAASDVHHVHAGRAQPLHRHLREVGLVSRTSYPTATRRGRRKAAKARATLSTISSFSSSGIRPRMS
jgi:hypothetical protein